MVYKAGLLGNIASTRMRKYPIGYVLEYWAFVFCSQHLQELCTYNKELTMFKQQGHAH